MKDDFDDGMGLPDDDLSDGPDLADMEGGAEGDIDIDLDAAMMPGGRMSGGARAGKASRSPKPAGASKRSAGARTPAPKPKGGGAQER